MNQSHCVDLIGLSCLTFTFRILQASQALRSLVFWSIEVIASEGQFIFRRGSGSNDLQGTSRGTPESRELRRDTQ